MFNQNSKDFYKLFLDGYYEKNIRSGNIRDRADYRRTMHRIIALEKKIEDSNPGVGDDLNNLGLLYDSLSIVKERYIFEEGVMLAMNMMLPRLLSKEFSRIDRRITEDFIRPDSYDDDEDDFDYEDEEDEDEREDE